MTKLQIIDETVEFYTNNPRANKITGGCFYQTEDGRHCAHSRCLTDVAREDIIKSYNTSSADHIISLLGDDCHKEQYRGHSVEFWNDIQYIHDRSQYWTPRGLSFTGKDFVETLKKKYNE